MTRPEWRACFSRGPLRSGKPLEALPLSFILRRGRLGLRGARIGIRQPASPAFRKTVESGVHTVGLVFRAKGLLVRTVCPVRLRRVQPAAWRRGGQIHTASLRAAARATQADPKRRCSRHRKTTNSAKSGSATFTGRIKLSP